MPAAMLVDNKNTPIPATEMAWGAPPPKRPGAPGAPNVRLESFVQTLRTAPGNWAKYPEFVTGGYASGLAARFPNTQWTTRKPGDDEEIPEGKRRDQVVHMWGRYVQPDQG